MDIVRSSDLTSTPWKNGQGVTKQFLIEPKGVGFPTDPSGLRFGWRVSCAQVDGENDFSNFPGYDRWLVVWRGDGLTLNGETLLPNSPLFFDGEKQIKCNLIGDPVSDFGIIFDREKYRASIEVMTLGRSTIGHKKGTILLFCTEETSIVDRVELQPGDLARIDNPHVIEIEKNSRLIIVRIFAI